MVHLKTMLELFQHARWANLRVLESLEGLDREEETGFRLLVHIITTEEIYLSRMRGEDPYPQNFWPEYERETLRDRINISGDQLSTFINEKGAIDIHQKVRYRNSKGTYFTTPIDNMLMHLALHGEHHRGQIARLVRIAGGDPAMTDYIAFIRST